MKAIWLFPWKELRSNSRPRDYVTLFIGEPYHQGETFKEFIAADERHLIFVGAVPFLILYATGSYFNFRTNRKRKDL